MIGRSALAAAGLSAAVAGAAPNAVASAADLAVEDLAGHPVPLADRALATLLFYEDEHAGAQNQKVRDRVGPITDRPENRARLRLLAVADVERWNFWPAKKYVIEDLRKIERKEDAHLYCDWKGRVRRALGLTRGKSGVILVGPDGRVRFVAEGPLAEPQIRELLQRLAELGVAIGA